ncbi:MAG: beta-ketoacyl-ACP synthase II [Anaerolineae bacterium]|nr:beta-ketoacyl-ACP synthase II [Anaerolineae bacterium]
MDRRRVVITGMGIYSPIGNSVADAWHHAANGISGIAPITQFDTSDLPVTFGGEVHGIDADEMFGRRESRRMDRLTHLAAAASQVAIEDSGIKVTEENQYNIGVLIGSGMGGISTILEGLTKMMETGHRTISPLLVPMMLPDSPAAKVSMLWGMRGPNMAISTACATGNNSIGEAFEMIRRKAADIMVAGSTEAGLVPLAMASFNNMHAISRRNDDPQRASRPFDRDRDGFVVSEGAATLVLEELEHAKARGAHIYAELAGYGCTSDAFHVTAPLEHGEGAQEAMRKAMTDAGVTIDDIDYINAHGTSTQLNDTSETKALKGVFGERAYEIPISSTKSVTGHLMGAAGSVEAVISIMAIQEQFVPPTINLENPDPECDLNYTPNVGIKAKIDTVISNSFGFGGHNAVLVFRRYDNGSNGS